MDADFDHYNNIKNYNIEDLGLLFSTTYINPWTKKPQEIFLSGDQNLEISEGNKACTIS